MYFLLAEHLCDLNLTLSIISIYEKQVCILRTSFSYLYLLTLKSAVRLVDS